MAHCVCSMEKKWDRAKGPISTPFDRTGYQSSSLRRSVRPYYMYVVASTVWHGSSSSRVGCLCVFSKPFLLFSIVVGLSDKRRSKQASATSSISIEKYSSRLEQQWEKSLTKIHLERGGAEWVSEWSLEHFIKRLWKKAYCSSREEDLFSLLCNSHLASVLVRFGLVRLWNSSLSFPLSSLPPVYC